MALEQSLTVYEHRESVCCHKVAITLAEKQIEAKTINILLEDQEQRQPAYLAINPLGMVPAIVHNGRTIVHSTIITEYLDDAFPDTPLMPKDPYWRARRRLWARAIDDGLHVPHIATISFIISFGRRYREQLDTPEKRDTYFNNIDDPQRRAMVRSWIESDVNSDVLARSLQAYDAFLSEMESALAESPWLAGGSYSLADIDVIPYLWRLSNLQLEMMWANRPRVKDWFGRVSSRPAFRSAIIDRELPDWVGGMRAAGAQARPTLAPVIAGFERKAA